METSEVLDTSIAIHQRQGVITIFTTIEFPQSITRDFHVLLPETRDYIKAIEVAGKLRKQGTPIGAIDILIAAMCLNRSSRLITKDSHFHYVKQAYPEFRTGTKAL